MCLRIEKDGDMTASKNYGYEPNYGLDIYCIRYLK